MVSCRLLPCDDDAEDGSLVEGLGGFPPNVEKTENVNFVYYLKQNITEG